MHGCRIGLFVGVALGGVGLAAVSSATDLRGTLGGADALNVTPVQMPPRYRAAYWEVPNGVLNLTTARPSVEFDLGVVLTGPGIAESAQPVPLRIEGGRCRPGTVVISPGTTLDITNADLIGHELYAVARGGNDRVVPAEVTSPRARRQVQLRAAGVYELRDVRQPSFRCWVIAGPGQGRLLLPNATGAFAATGLNDGDYTVKVYFEGAERASQAVQIRGREAQVQISLGGGGAAGGAAPPAGGDDDHHGHHGR